MARGARKAGVKRIVAASFTDETSDRLAAEVDDIEWLRVGQLGRLLTFLKRSGTQHARQFPSMSVSPEANPLANRAQLR